MDTGILNNSRSLPLASASKLVRNTYTLLALALFVGGATALLATTLQAPPMHFLLLLAGFYGLYFALVKMRNSAWALLLMLALSVFLGYSVGPILTYYLAIPQGGELVATALGSTGVVFAGLSAYTLISKKDFSFLQGFLLAGALVLLATIVISLLVDLSAFSMAISAAFVLFYSCIILYETSRLIHDPNANYILAAASLFVSIYALFLNFLHIFGASGE